MTIAKFVQPDFTSQNPSVYKSNIDASISSLARLGAGFSVFAQDTPNMTVKVRPGAVYNSVTGGYAASDEQTTAVLPTSSLSRIVRLYIDSTGTVGLSIGGAAVTPVVPNYPVGVLPIGKVTIPGGATSILDSYIEDERVTNSGLGGSRNSFLIKSSCAFQPPLTATVLRITMSGAGGGGGGGSSNTAETSLYGGGGGGGGGSIISRMVSPELLSISIGAGGAGGSSGMPPGTAATAGTAGGATTVTGASGLSLSCAGGGGANGSSTSANGTAGAAGAAGTGVAGVAGTAGTTNASGGTGGGVGVGGSMSAGGKGGNVSTTTTGQPGALGSGGGGGIGAASVEGGDGGDGFVLVEVF